MISNSAENNNNNHNSTTTSDKEKEVDASKSGSGSGSKLISNNNKQSLSEKKKLEEGEQENKCDDKEETSTTKQDLEKDQDFQEREQALTKRRYVLNELVETERDYVNDLGKIVEGYLEEIRRQLVDCGVADILTTGMVLASQQNKTAAASASALASAAAAANCNSSEISDTATPSNSAPTKQPEVKSIAQSINGQQQQQTELTASTSTTSTSTTNSKDVISITTTTTTTTAADSNNKESTTTTTTSTIKDATSGPAAAPVVVSNSSSSAQPQASSSDKKSPTLPEDLRDGKHKIIFGNIEAIYEFHRDHFLIELERCLAEPQRLGPLFKRYERRLNMYVVYCQNKPRSEVLVSEYLDSYFEVVVRTVIRGFLRKSDGHLHRSKWMYLTSTSPEEKFK